MNNINKTVRNNLCTGCGICEDVCPTHSIRIECRNGENSPVLEEKTCLGDKCGRCLKVCPGIGCNLTEMANKFFSNEDSKTDKYIGLFQNLHTGYSLDDEIRWHSASGGMVSQFLIYLLDKKIIDGAVVTGFSENDHITPVSYIARTKEDVLKARSSKYCPVALNKVGNEIKNSEGKYVIVGMPCHIQGFRKRASIDRKFSEHVVGYFSIYCSSNRTFYARDFLLKRYGVDKKEIKYFAFRDNGCLGSLVVDAAGKGAEFPSFATNKSSECRESKSLISISFFRYYGALRSFFKPRRCLTCIDHYGELADVCFGDIHIKPYSDDKVGISSWIVRNPYFEDLFKQAEADGYITMSDVNARILNESQKAMLYPKQRRAHAIMNMDRMIGRKTAQYDIQLEKPHLKDYVSEIVCQCQRFVGRHKVLWGIIRYLYDRRMNVKH